MKSDFYAERIVNYAKDKNIAGALTVCDSCGQLEFCHKPGPCKRSDQKVSKLNEEELSQVKQAINEDIIKLIVKSTNEMKTEDASTNDKLAAALEKISEVLGQRSQVPSQVTKVKVPPTWAKESFADYKEEVEAWEQAHPGDNFSKYSEFLNELKRNKAKPGLSDYVSSVVVEKTRLNKTVSGILDALKIKYELTKKERFENLISLMKNFKPSKSDSGEKVYTQIEKIETEFEALEVGSNIHFFLATFILKETFESEIINEIEKRSIEDDVEGVTGKNILTEMKQSFKKMRIEGKRETPGKDSENHENKTYYTKGGYERSRYGAWKNSRDFKDFSRTNSNNWRTKSGNRWRKSESKFRSGSRSHSRRRDVDYRSFKDLNQAIEQVLSKVKVLEENQEKMSKILEEKVVNNYVEMELVEEDWSQGMNIYFTKNIKGASEMVVDCGAPKSLIGENYLNEYLNVHNIKREALEKVPCKQKFKFGPSQAYMSTEKLKIPIVLKCDDRVEQQLVESYVIEADVPLLLGLNTMKSWRALMDIESEEMIFRSFEMSVKMKRNEGGHLTVPLERMHEWSTAAYLL